MSKTDTPAKNTSEPEDTAAPGTERVSTADEDAEAAATEEPEATDPEVPEPADPEPEAVESAVESAVEGAVEGASVKVKASGKGAAWRRVPGKAGVVRATVAVALAGSVVTAGLQWYQADQAAERDQDRRQVRASAAEFGQALLSYDHTSLQAARNHVLALASDDFAKTYDEAFTGGLEGVITKLKADATATVRAVYLGKIESGTAKAVVVMDSEVHSTAGTRRVLGSYLDMRLVRRGGGWKISDVTSVGAANESMTDPQGKRQTPQKGVPSPDPSP